MSSSRLIWPAMHGRLEGNAREPRTAFVRPIGVYRVSRRRLRQVARARADMMRRIIIIVAFII